MTFTDLLYASFETIEMVVVALLFAYLIGIPLGVLFIISKPKGLRENKILYSILGWIINLGRSIPFVIMLALLIPFTRLIMGTSLGTTAAIVPLTVASIPFVARVIEQSLEEVDCGVIEAAKTMGASTRQIIFHVYLKESIPSIIRGAALTAIAIIGYTAISGTMGAGGLGKYAYNYGYIRYQTDVAIYCVIALVIIVEIFQSSFNLIARVIDKKN